ncbi:MAG TPA: enoyl-CoA hydratase/isomerase family protein [Actinomycetota bacterium]|nr:enoyl-CoA hydratase/isomerase family protein [Actinomycetota bacterium]
MITLHGDADGRVVTLTLNRPEARNALSVEMCESIVSGLAEIDRGDARAVVIKGAGKVFCSGADLAAVSGPGASEFLPAFEHMLDTLARHRLPTVAAIHGAALGGGLQLAGVCDFRLAATDAKIGIPSSKLGILVNFENIERLVLLVGPAVAREMLMTGRTYSGKQAETVGLVNHRIPPEHLEAAADQLGAELAQRAPLSVQGTKVAIQAVVDHVGSTRAARKHMVEELDRLVAAVYASRDLQEGLRALAEKRPPNFEGH